MKNKLISDETYARIAHLTWNELACEYEKIEAKNEALQAELGRIVIAIKKGLTDKPSLEKIEAHIMDLLKSQGYFDDALLTEKETP